MLHDVIDCNAGKVHLKKNLPTRVLCRQFSLTFKAGLFSGEEKAHNPFMRVMQPSVRRFVGNADNDIDAMAAVRAAKDKFKMT